MKIAVGLSGGVDSSVAAALLKEAGHEVIGVTMKLWKEGRYAGGTKDACFGPGEEEDIARARELCKDIDIPYFVFDCSDAYEEKVLSYFRKEYLAGHTPNPCVRCNATMKFGVLPDLARQSGITFDHFATGHYARVEERNGTFHLLKGADEKKDQSYFLYRLSQQQLGMLEFPLGNMTKDEVRKEAGRLGLRVKNQPDSQDFYSGDHTELLKTPNRAGDIVDSSGKVLGHHSGFWHFTIGQRKGLRIASPEPFYVIGLNSCRNQVIVGSASDAISHGIRLVSCHWIAEIPTGKAEVRIRSGAKFVPCEIEGEQLNIPDGVQAAAKGQSAVLYRGEEVLGGGIISETIP